MMLSKKKKRFLEFVGAFSKTHDEPPTFEEIKSALGFKSLGTVNWYVRELVKSGDLFRAKGFNGKRALSVIEDISGRLPFLGRIAAGYPLMAFEQKETVEVPPSLVHPSNYVLQVTGDSMIEDNIEDGDYVVIRQVEEAESGQTVVAYVNGEATLKRYYPKTGGIELHPRNPEYDAIYVSGSDDFRIGGIVLHVFRNYAQHLSRQASLRPADD
tara:strand:+ start:1783 stop:2421 length:639 start_codon:yes stop_codon:yes gene_type:complete